MFFAADIEQQFFELIRDHRHIAAQGVDQLAGGVGVDDRALGGAVIGKPADRLPFVHPRQLDNGAILTEGVADALIAILVGHVHATGVGGDADVVGDEDEHGSRVRILAVLLDGREPVLVRGTAVETFHAPHEEHLEGRHQRRGAGAVEDLGQIGFPQVEFEIGLKSRRSAGTRCLRMASRQRLRKKLSSPTKT